MCLIKSKPRELRSWERLTSFPCPSPWPFGLQKSLKSESQNCQMEAAHWHGWCASSKTIHSADNRAWIPQSRWQPETARLKTQRTGPKPETHGKLSRACILNQVPKSSAFIFNPEWSSLAEGRLQMSIYLALFLVFNHWP